jgi:hypothetical protein
VVKARQVNELASEVAGASREQTQGITQINSAVGQMDKVTQSNAASAEESAAAAQELNSQSELMKQAVLKLTQLAGDAAAAGNAPAVMARAKAPTPIHQVAAMPAKATNGNGFHTPAAKSTVPARRGDIPMTGDFKDF